MRVRGADPAAREHQLIGAPAPLQRDPDLAAQAQVDGELAEAKSLAARARAEVRQKTEENARMSRELLGEGERP